MNFIPVPNYLQNQQNNDIDRNNIEDYSRQLLEWHEEYNCGDIQLFRSK